MKQLRTGFLLFLLCLLSCLTFTGCKEPVVTINYFVDGIKTDAVPDYTFYDVISIESTNEAANATWNENTRSLAYTPVKKDTEINIYFEYTKYPFKINGVGFESLQDAFNSAVSDGSIIIETTANYTGHATTPTNSDITLNLNGFTLDGAGENTIICNGKLIINGEGTITNSVSGDFSKSLVNYGALTINNVTIDNATSNVSVWNSNNGGSTMVMNECTVTHSQDCIVIINSGEMNLNNCTISGIGGETHPTIYSNTDIAVLNLNGGTVTNHATGYTAFLENGIININNCVIENTYGLE